MTTTYDAIIVGARCAGSATAMLLARQGLNVLVLERARYGADTVSTHALMRGGVLQLQRWGLLEQIVAADTPPVTRAVFHYPDDTTRISLKPAAGVDALYAPRRTVLDTVLADAAIAAGAEMRFESSVTGLRCDDTGRIGGVSAQDRTGRSFTATAPLVIGADGIRSLVAREVGAPVIRTAAAVGTAFLYGYWDDLPVEGYEWLYAPGGTGGLIPTNGGKTVVFIGTTPARLKGLRQTTTNWEAFDTVMKVTSPAVAERVAAARSPRHLLGFSGVAGYLRRSWGPGWALVGDAGCFLDPLSTHGITDALRDAETLAAAVVDVHGGAQTEAAALAGYQRVRDAASDRLFGVVGQIASHRWTMPELRRLLIEASSAMSAQVETLQGRLLAAPGS